MTEGRTAGPADDTDPDQAAEAPEAAPDGAANEDTGATADPDADETADETADAEADEADDEEDEEDDAPHSPPRRGVWWPAVAAALVALCLALAAVLVYSSDDDGSSTPGTSSPEAGFARDMAVHHQQAVEMSFLVRDDTGNTEVRRFAYDIINTQANQRGMMLGWLDMWGLDPTSNARPMAWMGGSDSFRAHDGALMPGMATNAQMDQLRKARGRPAEIMFLRLMIAHHKGGISMAQGVLDMSRNKHVDRLATTIVQGQRSEIDAMNQMLRERGAKPVS